MNYCKASYEDLEKIWNKDIEENKDDRRYIKWKDEFIKANKNGDIVTFVLKSVAGICYVTERLAQIFRHLG